MLGLCSPLTKSCECSLKVGKQQRKESNKFILEQTGILYAGRLYAGRYLFEIRGVEKSYGKCCYSALCCCSTRNLCSQKKVRNLLGRLKVICCLVSSIKYLRI